MTGLVTADIADAQQFPRARTRSRTASSLGTAPDRGQAASPGASEPGAPSPAWLQHLPAASDDPRYKPSGYLTDRTGVGRFMLTYGRCRSERSMAASAAPYATVEAMAAP